MKYRNAVMAVVRQGELVAHAISLNGTNTDYPVREHSNIVFPV